MGLLQEAYKSRDKICLISFHGESADVVVPPTKSTALTKSRLESMPCGSKTPLADALVKAVRTGLNAVKVKQDTGRVILVVISDCRPNVPLCVSNGEVFDPSVDPDSKDGLPSRSFLKKEALAIAKQIGALGDFDVLCIDTEDKFVRTGIAEELARFALGNYFGLGSHADSAFISQAVRKVKT
jgi:magnesium chelatase subunit D